MKYSVGDQLECILSMKGDVIYIMGKIYRVQRVEWIPQEQGYYYHVRSDNITGLLAMKVVNKHFINLNVRYDAAMGVI